MDGGSVRVPVDHPGRTALGQHTRHFVVGDVHDVLRLEPGAGDRGGPNPGRLPRPLLDRLREKLPLIRRVARVAPERLVLDVAGAERVSVQEHRPFAHHFDDVRLLDQAAPGALRECVAEQEVVIAADQIDGNAGGDGLGQSGFDPGVGRAIVVVAEPQIEHVAEEVEPIRPPPGAGQELRERGDRAGTVRGEMDVAREQEHYGGVGCITMGRREYERGRTSSERWASGRAMIVAGVARGEFVSDSFWRMTATSRSRGAVAGTAPTRLVPEVHGRGACFAPQSSSASGFVLVPRCVRRDRLENVTFRRLEALCASPRRPFGKGARPR